MYLRGREEEWGGVGWGGRVSYQIWLLIRSRGDVHVEAGHGLHDADLEVREVDELLGHEAVHLGVTGGALHDVSLSGLVGHGDGGDHVRAKVDGKDEDGGQRQGNGEDRLRNEGGDLGNVGRHCASKKIVSGGRAKRAQKRAGGGGAPTASFFLLCERAPKS
jgi:hypothetical protein